MRLRAMAVTVVLLWPVSGFAGTFKNGNELLTDCSAQDERSFECLGYVEGLADTLEVLKTICPAEGVTLGQFKDVILKYLRDHPEHRHFAAADEGGEALIKAFPCK
jgi:hypothetical protein